MLDTILGAFQNLFSLQVLLFINLGMAIGIIFGALPGLSATMGVCLFLPMTFTMEPVNAIIFLCSIYCGGIYGGSITAILINTPGSPAAVATPLDGYPLAVQGHASKALDTALVASTMAGIISALMLIFFAPQLAQAALKFGAAERFALALFGLSIIIILSAKNIFKGLISASIGLFISCVGLDSVDGFARFSFGTKNLVSGFDIIPVLVGLFAISEILDKVTRGNEVVNIKFEINKEHMTWAEFKSCAKDIIKSSFIGTIIGAIPGTGATTSTLLGYSEAQRSSKHPEQFGKGCLNGVAAAEAANNGVTGATLIPTLTLGIPGDTITAVLLGALTMQGLTPGPMLFKTQGTLMYTIMIGMVVINIFMLLQGKVFMRLFINILRVPALLLAAVLVCMCVVGAFTVDNTIFDVLVMLAFGAVGYLFKRLEIPMVPLILGVVLGSMAESNLRRALTISGSDWSVLFTRPISCVFIIISALIICSPLIRKLFAAIKAKKAKN